MDGVRVKESMRETLDGSLGPGSPHMEGASQEGSGSLCCYILKTKPRLLEVFPFLWCCWCDNPMTARVSH